MVNTNLKTAKSIVFDMETLVIVSKTMQERNINCSKATCFLIKQADYLLQKIKIMRMDQKEAKDGQLIK